MRTFPDERRGIRFGDPDGVGGGGESEGSAQGPLCLLGTKGIEAVKDGKGFNSQKAISRCGSSSVGRASAFQAEGRGFDPRFPLQFFRIQLLKIPIISANLSYSIDRFFFYFGPRSSVGRAHPW